MKPQFAMGLVALTWFTTVDVALAEVPGMSVTTLGAVRAIALEGFASEACAKSISARGGVVAGEPWPPMAPPVNTR